MVEDSIKKTISINIGKYRELAGMTQKELAHQLGITPSRVSNWEQGANCPTIDILFKVCEVLGVSINDIYGVYPDSKIKLSYEEIEHIKKYHDLDPHGRELVDLVLNKEAERCKNPPPAAIVEFSSEVAPRTHLMEYFRSASAGSGVFILGNEATSKIVVSEDDWRSNGDYVINVAGTSMIPLYNDGDKVIVSQRAEVLHGDIGIFIVNGNVFIKKYGENELISLNPDSDNIKISEYDNIVCMGKVIGKIEGEYEIIND